MAPPTAVRAASPVAPASARIRPLARPPPQPGRRPSIKADQPSPAPSYSAPIAAAPADRAPAPRAEVPASTDAPTAGRDPIPFPSRENSPRAIVLRLGGFRDQRDLLEFALTLEDVDVLAEVSLTRAEPADAWFAVRAASTQQVVAALQEVRGWLISTHASESYVEGRVEGGSVEVARVETEPVLPHRTRFRVFSPRRETTPVGAGFTIARSAAMQPMVAPADVAPARPIYTAPPMPVLPMPAHPAPIPQPEVHSVEPSRPVLPPARNTGGRADRDRACADPRVNHRRARDGDASPRARQSRISAGHDRSRGPPRRRGTAGGAPDAGGLPVPLLRRVERVSRARSE